MVLFLANNTKGTIMKVERDWIYADACRAVGINAYRFVEDRTPQASPSGFYDNQPEMLALLVFDFSAPVCSQAYPLWPPALAGPLELCTAGELDGSSREGAGSGRSAAEISLKMSRGQTNADDERLLFKRIEGAFGRDGTSAPAQGLPEVKFHVRDRTLSMVEVEFGYRAAQLLPHRFPWKLRIGSSSRQSGQSSCREAFVCTPTSARCRTSATKTLSALLSAVLQPAGSLS